MLRAVRCGRGCLEHKRSRGTTVMARRSWRRRLLVAGALVWFATRSVPERTPAPVAIEEAPVQTPQPAAPSVARSLRKRLAASLVFATLFFAGAAFTAGAGNEFAHVD